MKAAGEQALEAAYAYAHNSQDDRTDSWSNNMAAWAQGETWHRYASALTGALGGVGGLATTIVDLPVTTTLILRSIQQIASSHGEDLTAPEVRAECMIALGGPLPDDDDQNASLWTLRLALTGKVVAGIIAAAAPRFGLMISQKVLTQATPLLGAIAGGTINPLYTQYYQTMAHVHFRLLKMERAHDPEQVRACFERIFRAVRGR